MCSMLCDFFETRQELNLKGDWSQKGHFTMQPWKSLKSSCAFVKPRNMNNNQNTFVDAPAEKE